MLKQSDTLFHCDFNIYADDTFLIICYLNEQNKLHLQNKFYNE